MMINLIKTDINILVHKKGFQVSFLLVLAYALFVTLFFSVKQQGMDASYLYSPLKLSGLNMDTEIAWFFFRWFPFIIVLPAGFSIVNDKNTRIRVLIKSRVGNFKYYFSKLVSAFVITFITVVIPFLIQCVVNHIIFPEVANRDMTNWETYGETYFIYTDAYLFSNLYYENVYIYFVVALVLTGVFSGCLAVFLVGISTFEFKYKAVLFLPIYLVFYVLEELVGYIDDFPVYINEYLSLFDIIESKSLVYYFSIMLICLFVGIVLTIFNATKKERVD